MERRVVIGVAGLGCAVALAGCTSRAPGPLPPSSAALSSSTCGTDIPVGSGLIDATVISAPRGSAVGRSVSAVALTSPACGPPSTGVVHLTSCDPDEFPWTTSPDSRNQELFRQGVRVMRQAFLEVDGRPVLREVVLDASSGGALSQAYRDHLQGCRAAVLARANGSIQQAVLSGHHHLVVTFNGDQQMVALQGLAGQSAAELSRLMPQAMGLTQQ